MSASYKVLVLHPHNGQVIRVLAEGKTREAAKDLVGVLKLVGWHKYKMERE